MGSLLRFLPGYAPIQYANPADPNAIGHAGLGGALGDLIRQAILTYGPQGAVQRGPMLRNAPGEGASKPGSLGEQIGGE